MTTFCLAIIFARLSKGKMVGYLSVFRNELHKMKNNSVVYFKVQFATP